MGKLLKYLRKYSGYIFIIFILLIAQAFCDLALPGYTSNIVNVGIQQSGIESPVPKAVRESEMEKIVLFMDDVQRQETLDSYTLVNPGESVPEHHKLVSDSMIKYEGLYILNKEADEDKLAEYMGVPIMLTYSFDNESESVEPMKEEMLANFPEEAILMATDANGRVDMFAIFAMMPEEQMKLMTDNVRESLAAMPETLIEQSSIAFIKAEYQFIGINTDSMQSRYILIAGAKMLGLALLMSAIAIIVAFIASKVAARLSRELRSRVFHKVTSFSSAEYNKFSTASLITRSTNDIQQVQLMTVIMLRILLYAPVLAVGGVLKVLQTNVAMTWILALGVGVLLIIVLTLFIAVMPRFKMMQKLVDRINLVAREILTGIPVIRAFSTEEHEKKRFDKANKDLMKNQLFTNRVMSCMMPLMILIMNLLTILIVWVAAGYIDEGTMQVGDLMAFIQYAMMIIMAFLMLSMVSIFLPRASVSAVRIDEILTTEVTINDKSKPELFDEKKKGIVEFKDVSFKYPGADEDVLTNINFTASPGQTTAVIGSTGSGKSTLVNLIPRFFDVTKGSIIVDGVDIRDVSGEDLRARIGYVPQKGVLFSGTIESNIKFSDEEASDELMFKAARIAQAEDFINEKSDKYKAEISQGGTNVSGGQKQRLSIARAIAKNPEIYIFDDSFSALDYKTDVALRRALKEEIADSTIIIVAQRISTIINAEQIIVLDEGQMVGKGTHAELLDNCDVYRQIAMSQLSEEELNRNKTTGESRKEDL